MADEKLFRVRVKLTSIVEVQILAADRDEAARLGAEAATVGVGSPAEDEAIEAEVLAAAPEEEGA